MTHRRANKKNKLMLSIAAIVLLSSNALANETLKQHLPGKLEYVKYSKDFKIAVGKLAKAFIGARQKLLVTTESVSL